MIKQTALIAIDSGFSRESLVGAKHIISYEDLQRQKRVLGNSDIDINGRAFNEFLGDPLAHGERVLALLKEHVAGEHPIILIKACDQHGNIIRTQWRQGKIVRRGWVDAYRSAVKQCQRLGIPSVANCSFGGYTHAMDGTGWEAFQLRQAAGAGHVVVAAAGTGSESGAHASWTVEPGQTKSIESWQKASTLYNVWNSSLPGQGSDQWQLEVWLGDRCLRADSGSLVPANIWNGKQQHTFAVDATNAVVRLVCRNYSRFALHFHAWIQNDSAAFRDHVDKTAIVEPAVFPEVIAVGFADRCYSPDQWQLSSKPDILLEGGGMLSFRLPEVTAKVAQVLSEHPQFDSKQVLAVLRRSGKVLP